MIIEVVADIDGFSALRTEWNDLLSRTSADTIFLTWEWLFSSWDLLQLSGMPESSPTCGWLKSAEDEGIIVSRTESIPCLVAGLPDSWDEYLASLKPRFRTKVRSVLRDLTVSSSFRLHTVQT